MIVSVLLTDGVPEISVTGRTVRFTSDKGDVFSRDFETNEDAVNVRNQAVVGGVDTSFWKSVSSLGAPVIEAPEDDAED